MKLLIKPIAALGLLVATVAGANTASADTYDHIDVLALHIERQARLLVRESRQYQYTPEYRHIVADTTEMFRLTAHIHDLVRRRNCIAELERDVRELDSQFHHLEELFDRVDRNARRGHGLVGCTAQVRRLLESIEDDIHQLKDDLRSLRFADHTVRRYPTQPTTIHRSTSSARWGGYSTLPTSRFPVYGTPSRNSQGHRDYGRHGRSISPGRTISIGGGSSRFTFSF